MQRRAAALYLAFFVLLGVGALTYINVAQANQQPQFSLDGTAIEANGSATIGGTQYRVTELGHTGGGGGHGGGGGQLAGSLEWTNESAVNTATLDNGSSVTYRNESHLLAIPNESGVDSFTLREQLDVDALLRADPAVENTTATQNDTEYVVYRENQTLVPLSEYLPAPETHEFQVGDTYPHEGTETTVANVTASAVTLRWRASETQTRELTEGANVTLGNGQQYFVHIPSEERVQIVPIDQYDDYSTTQDERAYFDERINGLWGIVFVSFSAALILASAAYLPTRG